MARLAFHAREARAGYVGFALGRAGGDFEHDWKTAGNELEQDDVIKWIHLGRYCRSSRTKLQRLGRADGSDQRACWTARPAGLVGRGGTPGLCVLAANRRAEL